MTLRLNDQLYIRCSSADRKRAERIARRLKMKVTDYVRMALQEANARYEDKEAQRVG